MGIKWQHKNLIIENSDLCHGCQQLFKTSWWEKVLYESCMSLEVWTRATVTDKNHRILLSPIWPKPRQKALSVVLQLGTADLQAGKGHKINSRTLEIYQATITKKQNGFSQLKDP